MKLRHLTAAALLAIFASLPAAAQPGDPIAGRVIADSITGSQAGLVEQTVTLETAGDGSTLFRCQIVSGVSVCDGWDDLWLASCPDLQTLIVDDFEAGTTTTHRFCAQGAGAAVSGTAVLDLDEGPLLTDLQCLSP